MKWSVQKIHNECFFTLNGQRALTTDGNANVIAHMRACGEKIWIKFEGDRVGKEYDRSNFQVEECSFKEQLKGVTTNAGWLEVMQLNGIEIIKRKARTPVSRTGGIVYHAEPTPEKLPSSQLAKKLKGEEILQLDQLLEPSPEWRFRQVETPRVLEIKKSLRTNPNLADIGVKVPVLLKEGQYFLLGGVHLVRALRALNEESNENMFHNLRVDVFQGLDVMEILEVSAQYQSAQHSKPVTFQDKVCLARLVYKQEREGWKDQAVKLLSVLDGKLFRSIQGLSNIHKVMYLERAVGTSGMKTATQVADDQRRARVRKAGTDFLQDVSPEKKKKLEDRIDTYTGDVKTQAGLKTFKQFLEEEEETGDLEITVNVSYKGVELNKKFKPLIDITVKKLKAELNKRILVLEE